jgi:hypothetical protein
VLDIGANDGTLLSFYEGTEAARCGVDPARNLSQELAMHADLVVPTFFPTPDPLPFRAKIVTAIAMVYDLEEPMEFLRAVAKVLHPEGVFVLQFGDLASLLKNNAWDGICHEHLEYYTLTVMEQMLHRVGLRVTDAARNTTNGGSIRLFAVHQETVGDQNPGVRLIRALERTVLTEFPFMGLYDKIQDGQRKVQRFLSELSAQGKVIDVYGASTKGNTLLQTWGLDHRLIRRALERDPHKFGRFTVASWIPIVSEEEGMQDPAAVWLVLPWHFRERIMKRALPFLQGGGQLLFPLPTPELVWTGHDGAIWEWTL